MCGRKTESQMAKDTLLSPGEIRELFDLNIETGELRWKPSTARGRHSQTIAGSINLVGYRQIKVGKKSYLAHRVVWAIAHGEWPKAHIDHIDGDRSNNAMSNLRLVTVSQNAQNRAIKGVKTASGLMGATHVPGTSRRRERWESRIKVNGVSTYLGSFKTPQEAQSAYLQAKSVLHPYFARNFQGVNHGQNDHFAE